MKSKVLIFVILSAILSGCSGTNNNTVGKNSNKDNDVEHSTTTNLEQTTNTTPEQIIVPTQVSTIEPIIDSTDELTMTNSPEITNDKINSDCLIIPGVSLGKIKLNMDVKEVYDILGTPSQKDGELIIYDSKKEENYIGIFLTDNKVSEIIFKSPTFETADGDRIDACSNVELNIEQYNAWKFQWLLMQVRYTLKDGGLTFYTFNVDSADDNMEHPRNSIGILHEGENPDYTPIEGANWKKWDGGDIYN
jgi:hypothetical protein